VLTRERSSPNLSEIGGFDAILSETVDLLTKGANNPQTGSEPGLELYVVPSASSVTLFPPRSRVVLLVRPFSKPKVRCSEPSAKISRLNVSRLPMRVVTATV
jgi:hypothetical protein